MFTNHEFLLERLDKYLSPIYWKDINIRSILYANIYPVDDILVFRPDSGTQPSIQFILMNNKELFQEKVQIGQQFGPSWRTFWFQFDLNLKTLSRSQIDENYQQNGMFWAIRWDSSSEAMIYSAAGEPLQGFTGGNGGDRRDLYIFPVDQLFPQRFYIEMACNEMAGNGQDGMINPPNPNKMFPLSAVELVQINGNAFSLLWDLEALYDLAKTLHQHDPISVSSLQLATQIMNSIQLNDPKWVVQAHEYASNFFLRNDLPSSIVSGCKLSHEIFAIGHCHIDTAWLWPYAETRRKIRRSWATQANLLERYPEWKFVASQAIHWQWLVEDSPELFTKILPHVQMHRFIPIGSCYVEFDANIPSGESMIRQFLYGEEIFKGLFGESYQPNRVFWLPDTFGYSGQLPQIMQGFNIDYFLSQKLSWNITNKFPHTTFLWQGIDGTNVLAHFPPSDTYGSNVTVEEVLRCSNQNNKSRNVTQSLLLFGFGDGGGGPTASQLERLSRLQHCPGIPKMRVDKTPEEFFDGIVVAESHLKSSNYDLKRPKLAKWIGELYLELHQGTLTSQSLIKAQNRYCETLLLEVETLLVYVYYYDPVLMIEDKCLMKQSLSKDLLSFRVNLMEYRKNLKKLWKDVLLNQFHDVIPGSSIGMVYEDSNRMLTYVIEGLQAMSQELLLILKQGIECCLDTSISDNAAVFSYNGIGFDRHHPSLCLKTNRIDEPITVHSHGLSLIYLDVNKSDETVSIEKVVRGTLMEGNRIELENNLLLVTLSTTGGILSILDKRFDPPREVIQRSDEEEFGNRLVIYEDVPFYWDAWDTFPYHLEKGRNLNSRSGDMMMSNQMMASSQSFEITTSSTGKSVMVSYTLIISTAPLEHQTSQIIQKIILNENSNVLEFETAVDWYESHKLLKVEFPLNILSSFASYDIQYGIQQRPTHSNTPYDKAMFEVCGHKFGDLSEADYGVSLLNDCKYGYSCRNSTLCLTLLRSPKAPDRECDMGSHRFRYGLFMHPGGNVLSGKVVETAYQFSRPLLHYNPSLRGENHAMRVSTNLQFHGLFELLSDSRGGLVVEVIKMIENLSSDAVVVRLFESSGSRGTARLHSFLSFESVCYCFMNEESEVRSNRLNIPWKKKVHPHQTKELDILSGKENVGNYVHIEYNPFQIITLKIQFNKKYVQSV